MAIGEAIFQGIVINASSTNKVAIAKIDQEVEMNYV